MRCAPLTLHASVLRLALLATVLAACNQGPGSRKDRGDTDGLVDDTRDPVLPVETDTAGVDSDSDGRTDSDRDANTLPEVTALPATTDEDTPVRLDLRAVDPNAQQVVRWTVARAPAHGELTLEAGDADGREPVATYTPDPDYHGPDELAVVADDGIDSSEVVTIALTVRPVNDAPVAADLVLQGDEDTSIQVTAAATDVDGDALTWRVVTPPASAAAALAGALLTVTPDADVNGTDALVLGVSDGTVEVLVDVSLTFAPVPDAPVLAGPVALTVAEDGVLPLPVSCTDADGDPVTLTADRAPDLGTLSALDSAPTYTPDADAFGTDEVVIGCTDGTLFATPLAIDLTITPVNDPPVATASAEVLDEDVPAAFTLQAFDPDGDTLTYAITLAPTAGQLAGTAPDLTYLPDPDVFGADSLTFEVSDGTLSSAPATVSFTVRPVADPPVVTPPPADALTGLEDEPLTIPLSAVDPEGDAPTYAVVTTSAGVFAAVDPTTGVLTVTPSPGFSGPAWVEVTATDASGTGPVLRIPVDITFVDDPATVADPGPVVVAEDSNVGTPLFLWDEEGATPTLVVVGTGPGIAQATPGDAYLTVEPVPDFAGDTWVDVAADDGNGPGPTQRILYTFQPVNDPPTAVLSTGVIDMVEDAGPTDVTVQLVDAEGDPATASVLATAPGVSASWDPASGTLTVTTETGFSGSAWVDLTVTDGTDAAVTRIPVEVAFVNDPPEVLPPAAPVSLTEDTSLSLPLFGFDEEGATLQFEVVEVSPGLAASVSSSDLVLIPDADFAGTGWVDVRAWDGAQWGPALRIPLTVVNVNDPPVATQLSFTVTEDVPQRLQLGVVDADGDPVSVTIITAPARANAGPAGSDVDYAPFPDANGTDALLVLLDDGTTVVGPITLSVVITPVDDPPRLLPQTFTVEEDGRLTTPVLAEEVDGQTLTWNVITEHPLGVRYGSLPLLDFQGAPDAFGTGVILVTVTDGTSIVGPVPITVDITPVNDPPVAPERTAQGYGNQTITSTSSTRLDVGVTDVEGDAVSSVPGVYPTPLGATVEVFSDGSFVYRPAVGVGGTFDTVELPIVDAGGATSSARRKFDLRDVVWWADEAAPTGGDGTQARPFRTIAEAVAASAPGDVLRVRASTPQAGSIQLLEDQILLGGGVKLPAPNSLRQGGTRGIGRLAATGITTTSPGLEPAGVAPTFTGGAGLPNLLLAQGASAAGIVLDGGNVGVQGTAGRPVGLASITVRNTASDGIRLSGIAGLEMASVTVAQAGGHGVVLHDSADVLMASVVVQQPGLNGFELTDMRGTLEVQTCRVDSAMADGFRLTGSTTALTARFLTPIVTGSPGVAMRLLLSGEAASDLITVRNPFFSGCDDTCLSADISGLSAGSSGLLLLDGGNYFSAGDGVTVLHLGSGVMRLEAFDLGIEADGTALEAIADGAPLDVVITESGTKTILGGDFGVRLTAQGAPGGNLRARVEDVVVSGDSSGIEVRALSVSQVTALIRNVSATAGTLGQSSQPAGIVLSASSALGNGIVSAQVEDCTVTGGPVALRHFAAARPTRLAGSLQVGSSLNSSDGGNVAAMGTVRTDPGPLTEVFGPVDIIAVDSLSVP